MSEAVIVEDQAIRRLETAYMRNKFGQTYIACEHINFFWSKKEVPLFRDLWREGCSIKEIEEILRRPQNDIAALVLDQSEKGLIIPRKYGLFG